MITDGVIFLRAPEPSDVDCLYFWENDSRSWNDGRVRAPMSRHILWQFVRDYNPDVLAAGQGRFMICLEQAGGVAAGMIDLYDVDALNRRAGIGIYIGAEFRKQGLAARALELLAGYSAKELGLHQLWAVAGVRNTASGSLFERCGFKVSGRLKSWIRVGESYGDAFVFQRLLVD